MNFSIAGIGVSGGIAIGHVSLLERGVPEVPSYTLAEELVDAEVERFSQAVDKTIAELQSVRERIPASAPADIAAFIDTHLLMLDDSALRKVPAETIRQSCCNAEWALKLQRDILVSVFEEMDDPYLRTRKDDVIHVVNSILRSLQSPGGGSTHEITMMSDRIVVADDLTPADTILLHHQGIAALLTEYGGPLSHTAILARSLRIPMLVGVHGARQCLRNNDHVILDGHHGQLVVTEDTEMLRGYRELQLKDQRHYASLDRLRDKPAVSTDGVEVHLQANIELPGDIEMMEQAGASGVGLFRTEFLFMNRSQMPDEDEQFEVYRSVVQALKGKPLTLRTLDLGADKTVDGNDMASTTNPALGLRAIRLCLHDPDLFYPQLRAILRASVFGPVRLMVPMMSTLVELRQVLRIIGMVKQELQQAGKAYDENIPIGAMIEVPSAALQSYHFARELDFLSIGTNDLTQYTMAIDRVDDEVNYLYDPLNPAVLRLIYLTLRSGRRAGTPVAMCGEMAGDRRFTRLLLGMGLRELSMQATSCLDVKDMILRTDCSSLTRQVRKILASAEPDEIDALLTTLNA